MNAERLKTKLTFPASTRPGARYVSAAAEVCRRVQDLASGGGFVVNAVHNIQPLVRSASIVAMMDAAREDGTCRPHGRPCRAGAAENTTDKEQTWRSGS